MPTKPTTTKRATTKRSTFNITDYFRQWLGIKDEGAQLAARQEILRDRQKEYVKDHGYKDDKGNIWFDLPEPVAFTDHKGKVFKFASLKLQRSLTPAQPTPDGEKAEALLRKKKLWLTPEQEKVLQEIVEKNRFVNLYVEVNVDAVVELVFNNKITDKEYEATLVEQKENFSFIPAES